MLSRHGIRRGCRRRRRQGATARAIRGLVIAMIVAPFLRGLAPSPTLALGGPMREVSAVRPAVLEPTVTAAAEQKLAPAPPALVSSMLVQRRPAAASKLDRATTRVRNLAPGPTP